MRQWVVGGLVLCLASPVFGQGQSLSETATRVLAAQEPPAGHAAWAQRMERAKAKRDGGKALLIGGLVVAGVGAALIPIAKWRNKEIGGGDISPEDQFYAAIGIIGGAGMSLWGGMRYANGKQEVQDLEREGRAKGYQMTHLRPMAVYTVTFD